jgi:hypothetical protein
VTNLPVDSRGGIAVRLAPILACALALARPVAAAEPAQPPAATPAPAQPARPAQPASAEAVAIARALLPEPRWDRLLDGYASGLAAQLSQSLTSSGKPVPDGLVPRLRAEMDQALPYEGTIELQAQALSRQLSADELQKANAFYSSPAGRKILEKLPVAQEEVGQTLQTRLSAAVPKIVQRVAPDAMSPAPSAPSGPAQESPPAQGRKTPPAAGKRP